MMTNETISPEALSELRDALSQRLSVIADHEFRDRDSAGHLKALQSASEQLAELESRWQSVLPPRLRHFLERRSYDKALEFAGEMLGEHVDH